MLIFIQLDLTVLKKMEFSGLDDDRTFPIMPQEDN